MSKSWQSLRVHLNERIALVAILLLAFALRVYRLDAQAIWWDESLSVYRATRDLGTVLANTIVIQNVVTVDTLPQLYFVFLNLLVRAFGISEFALRFFSVMANVATIPLVYVLARRWLSVAAEKREGDNAKSKSTALIAALLGALSPFYVWYAQEARPYALVLFWSTLAVYALVRAFGSRSTPRTCRFTLYVLLWLLVYLLAAVAALFTHYYSIFLLPFHAILIAALIWQHTTWRERVGVLLPAIPFAFVVFLLPQVSASAAGNVDTGPYFVPFWIILRDLLNSFSVGVTADLADVWWMDGTMLILFIIGIFSQNPKTKIPSSKFEIWDLRFGILLLAYILVPIAGLQILSLARPLYQNSRYLIAISPAFYLGVAAGIVALARRWRIVAVPALAMCVIGAAMSLNNLYFDPRFGKDDHRAWAAHLRERARPGDLLILNSPHAEELYRYYADDIVPMTTLPILRADGVASPDADAAVVRAAYRRNERVWYLAMHVPFDDPQKRIEALLHQEGALIDQASFAGTSTAIALSLFMRALPIAQPNEIAHPLDVPFSGNLRLRGYWAPQSLGAGKRGIVKLYWQIDEPVGEDYAVSLRLVDDAGILIGQWDTIPLGNRAGTSTWESKKIFIDTHDLPIAFNPPPGNYRLQVVPYHAATGNPLGDVITLGQIEVR